RSLVEIARANVFTRFNAILGTMFVLILVFGDSQDGLFGLVLVTNALIGIVQEWRAKRKLGHLAVLSAPSDAVVLDELLDLRTGDQVVADGIIREADGLEIDESLLTGESEPVDKMLDAE